MYIYIQALLRSLIVPCALRGKAILGEAERKGERNSLTVMMEDWLPSLTQISWTTPTKGLITLWERQIIDKGMHIARYMSDGRATQRCSIIEVDMQEVLGCLLLPGQPMIYNIAKQNWYLSTSIVLWATIRWRGIR